MPDCMAHYQFGQDVLDFLDGDLKLRVLSYKREYDVGLQGPDIFFFHQPYRENEYPLTAPGSMISLRPGCSGPILEKVRETPLYLIYWA